MRAKKVNNGTKFKTWQYIVAEEAIIILFLTMDFYFGDQMQKEGIVYFGKSHSLCGDVN